MLIWHSCCSIHSLPEQCRMTLVAVLLKFDFSSDLISVTLLKKFLVRYFQSENIKKQHKTTVHIYRTNLPTTERKRSRNQWRCKMLFWNFLQNDLWTFSKPREHSEVSSLDSLSFLTLGTLTHLVSSEICEMDRKRPDRVGTGHSKSGLSFQRNRIAKMCTYNFVEHRMAHLTICGWRV